MAFADCFGSYLCQIVELSMVEGAIRLHRIVSVCDPGRVLDRVNAASNIEGGVVWGLSAALYSSITFSNGHLRETNFDRFRVATLPDTPELITAFLENRDGLGGIGEVGPVCIPAALCTTPCLRQRADATGVFRWQPTAYSPSTARSTPEWRSADGAVQLYGQRLASNGRC
jgi:CO/xanthine dehydrogenase Mo-binding subunit